MCNSGTGQRVPLHGSRWVLGCADNGQAYLAQQAEDEEERGEVCFWADELLPARLFQDAQGNRFILQRGETQAFEDFMGGAHTGELKYTFKGESLEKFQLTCCCFRQSSVGSRVWWQLESLYQALEMTSFNHNAGKWVREVFPQAKQLAEEALLLGGLHVRYGQRMGHSEQSTHKIPQWQRLPSKGVSTMVMIGLLSRWSRRAGKGRLMSEAMMLRCRRALDVILADAWPAPAPVRWQLVVSGDEKLVWPLGVQGEQKLLVDFDESGYGDFTKLQQCNRTLWSHLLGLASEEGLDPRHMDPVQLMVLSQPLASLRGLWRQLVWLLAEVVDNYVSTELGRRGATTKNSLRLGGYLVAARQHFSIRRHLSLSLDFARVGFKKRGFGIIAASSGVGAVLPPQAASVNKLCLAGSAAGAGPSLPTPGAGRIHRAPRRCFCEIYIYI